MADITQTTPLAEGDRRWLPVFGWGHTSHPTGDFFVDEAFVAECERFARDMAARGYYAPVKFTHAESALRYGRALPYFDRRADSVYQLVEFAAGIAELYDKGMIDGISPTFYRGFVDPHTGEVYEVGVRDVSVVDVPHQKNLPNASPHYTPLGEGEGYTPISALEGSGMDPNETETENENEQTENEETSETGNATNDKLDKILASVESINTRVEALEKATAAKNGEDKTTPNSEQADTELTRKITQLSEQVTTERKARRRLEIKAALGAKVEAAQVDRLVRLSEVDEGLYRDTLADLRTARAPKPKGESGTPGAAPPTPPVTCSLGEILGKAAKEGVERGSGLVRYVREQGGDVTQLSEALITKHFVA